MFVCDMFSSGVRDLEPTVLAQGHASCSAVHESHTGGMLKAFADGAIQKRQVYLLLTPCST
jgi:hypothetical protein